MVNNLPTNEGDARDAGLIPGLERSPEVGNGTPLQHSCLENSMDRGAWQADSLPLSHLGSTLVGTHSNYRTFKTNKFFGLP